MSPPVIPEWTSEGVLPPVNAAQPNSPDRSPYPVSLSDVVLRFSTTPERRTLLGGFLRYRAALHAAGLVQGFQWLDGSFLENIELVDGRAPNDIDVVTFYRMPAGVTQAELAARLGPTLLGGSAKLHFHVDAYLAHLGMDAARLTRQSAYWYSVWAHRRAPSHTWKGFVQVDLAPAEDPAAATTLASTVTPGAHP